MGKTTTFYSKFDRHAHGHGLKGHSTHYCPGCGHGLAHKYLAEAIDELEIQDRTVSVSPVGCSVFLYYYMDVGNTQAAHGRAPAVAIGHKVANPDSIVVSYQGDGDLASIGLAEIVHTAQVGLPITVIFVNNAIYGMTGGQMAPTTLMGQKTATSPGGRTSLMGQPFKMAELIAQLDGPVYVERVALFNSKERNKAKRAIKKGLQLQKENAGFTFIEVLAECPTHLKMTPIESEKWVEENMLPIFPLGIKKDLVPTTPIALPWPTFEPERVINVIAGKDRDQAKKHTKNFASHIHPSDISMKLAGSGGDGAQTAAMLIAQATINEGFDATHIPSYGPESRGGTSYADVHVAKTEVLSPASPNPDILIAFNTLSVEKFGSSVKKGGIIIYDSSVTKEKPHFPHAKCYGVPFTEIAVNLGKVMVKNIVALGALQAATQIFPEETFFEAIRMALKSKCALIPMNEEAFRWGIKAVQDLEH